MPNYNDPMTMQRMGFLNAPPDIMAKAADIQRQQDLAKLLSQQGAEPIKSDQMVHTGGGKWAAPDQIVPVNWAQGLGKMAQAGVGAYMQNKASDNNLALANQLKDRNAAEITDFTDTLRGSTGVKGAEGESPAYGSGTQDDYSHLSTPAIAPDMQGAMAKALRSNNPLLQSAGGSMLTNQLDQAQMDNLMKSFQSQPQQPQQAPPPTVYQGAVAAGLPDANGNVNTMVGTQAQVESDIAKLAKVDPQAAQELAQALRGQTQPQTPSATTQTMPNAIQMMIGGGKLGAKVAPLLAAQEKQSQQNQFVKDVVEAGRNTRSAANITSKEGIAANAQTGQNERLDTKLDNKNKYTNIQPDGKGGMIGFNASTKQMEAIPMAGEAASKITGGAAGGAGGREATQLNRIITSGNEAVKDIQNIAREPITASSGIWGTLKQGGSVLTAPFDALVNNLTTQEVQSYKVKSSGLIRSLATIESVGLMPSNSLVDQMKENVFKENDTYLTKIQKLAQTRQIVEAANEAIQANPRVSKEQKDFVAKISTDMAKAVPYTHEDIDGFTANARNNHKLTLESYMKSKNAATGGAAPQGVDPKIWAHVTPEEKKRWNSL